MTSLPIIRYNVIMSNCWIGVVGKNGSGKSTVCDHLEAQGFHLISLSDVVRDYANRVSVPHDRDSLTSLANQMKLENGADYFASVALKMIQDSDHEKVVFDSVRHPDEIKYLKKYNVFFIAVDAPIEQRYERISQRGKETDFVSFDEFKRQDLFEASGQSFGQRIIDAMALCHVTINNNSNDLCNLLGQVDDIIQSKLVNE